MQGIVKFIVFCQYSLRRTYDEHIHNKSHKRINIQKYKLLKSSNCWQHILHLSMLFSFDTTWKESLFAITGILHEVTSTTNRSLQAMTPIPFSLSITVF